MALAKKVESMYLPNEFLCGMIFVKQYGWKITHCIICHQSTVTVRFCSFRRKPNSEVTDLRHFQKILSLFAVIFSCYANYLNSECSNGLAKAVSSLKHHCQPCMNDRLKSMTFMQLSLYSNDREFTVQYNYL